jgi:flagellar hook protein FlgE
LTFDKTGTLTAPTTDPTIGITGLTSGAANLSIAWDIDTAGASNGSLTQYAATSSLTNTSQDGIAPGQLQSISTDDNGIITASYSNGETKSMFQLALADFNNYNGLNKTGNNLYRETPSSGAPIPGVAGSGKFGTLATGSLESSNVDMAQEMSNMIVAQRSYESCARMFTTESELLETTVNMGK